jgi:hypothetical protein
MIHHPLLEKAWQTMGDHSCLYLCQFILNQSGCSTGFKCTLLITNLHLRTDCLLKAKLCFVFRLPLEDPQGQRLPSIPAVLPHLS